MTFSAESLGHSMVFSNEDFDAYRPEKWRSNMWNRARLTVKEKLLHLVPVASAALEEHGLHLESKASDEHPSLWNKKEVNAQWLFFSRGENERAILQNIIDKDKSLAHTLADPTPFFRHIFLCIMLNHDGVEAGLRIHRNAWVDWQNLLRRIERPEALSDFIALLRSLPERFEVGITGGDLSQASRITPDMWGAIQKRFDEQEQWFFVGHRLGRSEAVALETRAVEILKEDLLHLAGIYRHISWTKANDFISIDEELRMQELQRSAVREESERQRHIRAAHTLDEDQKRKEHRAELEATIHDEQARREKERALRRAARPAIEEPRPPKAPEARKEPVPLPSPERKPEPARKAALAPTPAAEPSKDELKPVGPSSHVMIKAGVFKGKRGLVMEIKKDSAKVLLGLMATWIPVADLLRVAPPEPAPKRRSAR